MMKWSPQLYLPDYYTISLRCVSFEESQQIILTLVGYLVMYCTSLASYLHESVQLHNCYLYAATVRITVQDVTVCLKLVSINYYLL